jgi:hypothetical protein
VDKTDNQAILAGQPNLEVSDIFRRFGHLLKGLSKAEAKVVSDILNCRTAVLGGHKLACDHCDHSEYAYNSCRNRHCPKCQFLTKAKWVEARKRELLPVEYFHVVFTVPHELNSLLWSNKKIGFDILFRATSETLKEVGETRLKARLGFTAVLHTWSQTLNRHAHIHAVVPGGGLSLDGKKWISCKQGYLVPTKILAKVFRGKFLDYLERAFENLNFPNGIADLSESSNFKKLLIAAAKKEWVIYAKPPFAGPTQVLEYLGNYTHRIAISNYRIEAIDGDYIAFKYKDRQDDGKSKIMRLHAKEFMRKFLFHVLPPKFIRIRHFGFLGSRLKAKNIANARQLLGSPKNVEIVQDDDYKSMLKRLTGIDVTRCPYCKTGTLIEVQIVLAHPNLRPKSRVDSS